MKSKHYLILLAAAVLCALCPSCRGPYDTSGVAMHSGGYTVARSPATGMMMGMPNTSRHQAEAQKSQAFYGRR